jgi:hypothetical protein
VYSIAVRNELPDLRSMIAVAALRDTLRQWAAVSRISRSCRRIDGVGIAQMQGGIDAFLRARLPSRSRPSGNVFAGGVGLKF